MPAIQGTKLVAKEIYAWLQAHKKEGIIIEAGNNDGLEVHHERFGTTWAIDQIGFNLVELPQAVTWPQSGKERPSRK